MVNTNSKMLFQYCKNIPIYTAKLSQFTMFQFTDTKSLFDSKSLLTPRPIFGWVFLKETNSLDLVLTIY